MHLCYVQACGTPAKSVFLGGTREEPVPRWRALVRAPCLPGLVAPWLVESDSPPGSARESCAGTCDEGFLSLGGEGLNTWL